MTANTIERHKGKLRWRRSRILNAWVRQFNASGENAALFKKWFGYEMPVALK